MILRPEYILSAGLCIGLVLAVDTRSSNDNRPRGVGPEFAKFFKSNSANTFTCVSNPGISIPFSRVNDDFCDCPDGSDEPGTSACSYLSPLSFPQYKPGLDAGSVEEEVPNVTLALPGFYCKNKGHLPGYLKFESVNDGKCDYDVCCDGSDEWAGVGGIKCEDRCKEIGKEYKKVEEARVKAMAKAMKRKKELVNVAQKKKQEALLKIEALEISLKGYEIKVTEAEETLKTVERREKARVIKGDAIGKSTGKLGVLNNLAKARVGELRSSLQKTKQQRDDMVSRVHELEGVLMSLKEDHNPNFNDEGVKRAVRGWEDYAERETNDHWSDAEDRDLEAIIKEDGEENGINWTEFEVDDAGEPSDVEELYRFASYLPPGLRTWIDERIAAVRQILVENGILSNEADDATLKAAESKAVQTAKKQVEDAKRDLSNTQNDLQRQKDDSEKDYGPEDVFRALKDQCISKDSGEYTYELCWLSSAKQKPKKGHGDTNMGNFVGFDREIADDVVGPEAQGLGKGERLVLKYENGQHCWNGPNRSTRVVLACSEKEEIWKISESEKCVYRMEVGTAAVCGLDIDGSGSNDKVGKSDNKDEL